MQVVKGATASETKLIKAIQGATHSKEDGFIGTGTLCDIASNLGAKCWPVTLCLYGQPTIICNDINVCNPHSSCNKYKNSLSGSFSYQRKPCSMLVNDGQTVHDYACHAWLGQPETVLFRLTDGSFGVQRVQRVNELPKNLRWAVGGLGLLYQYAPAKEGFTGKYSDVLRRTNHTVLGVKNNLVYLIYCKDMTADQVNAHCKKLKLNYAVMLDGGHVAAINGEESFAKINTRTVQWYMIQGV